MIFWLLKVSLRRQEAAFRNTSRGKYLACPTVCVGLLPTCSVHPAIVNQVLLLAGEAGWGEHCRGYNRVRTAPGVWADMYGNYGLANLRVPLKTWCAEWDSQVLASEWLGFSLKIQMSRSQLQIFNLNFYQIPQVIWITVLSSPVVRDLNAGWEIFN